MAGGIFSGIARQLRKRRELAAFRNASTEDVFTQIWRDNKWSDPESRSGTGSNLAATAVLAAALPELLTELGVSSLLDIPCGDFHWMQAVALPVERYVGADIVGPLVVENARRFGNAEREFVHLDLLRDPLPAVDAIFCRDCLVHLCFTDIARAVDNIRASGAVWLLTTHFPEVRANVDKITGKHHALNLTRAPFRWPEPVHCVVEQQAGKRRGDKCLAVWRIADLPASDGYRERAGQAG